MSSRSREREAREDRTPIQHVTPIYAQHTRAHAHACACTHIMPLFFINWRSLLCNFVRRCRARARAQNASPKHQKLRSALGPARLGTYGVQTHQHRTHYNIVVCCLVEHVSMNITTRRCRCRAACRLCQCAYTSALLRA